MKQIGSEDARRTFRDLLDDAQRGEAIEVTRNAKPIAVLVPIGWYHNAQGVKKGVYAFTHDTDGNRLPGESELPVGELMSAIGEAAISELEKRDEARAKLTKAEALIGQLERITTAWTRGMYSARIDCWRGDMKAAVECLSEGLDGYDGPEWDGTETGAEWWERTKAEEGL